MEMILFLLVVFVWTLFSFGFGIVVGIKDCKRRFNIPLGEMPVT